MSTLGVTPADALEFWFDSAELRYTPTKDQRARWFQRSDQFDEEIRERFEPAIDQALNGQLDHWRESLPGQLALILLLDQFSRNLYRGSARAFAGDQLALEISQAMVRDNSHTQLGLHQRAFAGMPLEHSELAEVQEQSVAYFDQLRRDFAPERPNATDEDSEAAAGYYRFAVAHQEVIQEFGRYPHRNAALGRPSTPEEKQWLDNGGGF